MTLVMSMFPQKPPPSGKGQKPGHSLCPKSVKHDVFAIRKRTKALRRLAVVVASAPNTTRLDLLNAANRHGHLGARMTPPPLQLKTVTSPPVRNL